MASQPQGKQAASRWGGFLSQAIAGVESKLDTILAEPEDGSARSAKGTGVGSTVSREPKPEQPGLKSGMTTTPAVLAVGSSEKALSRSPSVNKIQDRLQQRLAKAMAKNNSATSLGAPSRTASPAAGSRVESPRPSMEKNITTESTTTLSARNFLGTKPQPEAGSTAPPEPKLEGDIIVDTPSETPPMPSTPDLGAPPRPSFDSHRSLLSRQSTDSARDLAVSPEISLPADDTAKTSAEYEAIIVQMRSDHEVSELRRQEEIHTYTERIDALESKVQYLARESSDAARKEKLSAAPGSLQKKLAEKDEQITALMEEGQKLSKSELKYMNIIKKLRAKSTEEERNALEMKRRLDRAEREAQDSREKAKRALEAEKRATDRLQVIAKIEKEVEGLQSERDSSRALVVGLQTQLAEAIARAETAQAKAQTNALEAEKRLVQDLKDDLSNAKIEKELSEERLRTEIRELKEKMERERERAKIAEMELMGEQSVLESKLEALRARHEEVSTGATSDSQAKLLRQIETLQTQYAVASENWQGIEGTLQARVTSLEKERDELSTKESQMRRKAREANLKSNRMEEELENTASKLYNTERDLTECQEQVAKLLRRVEQSEAALADAKAQMEQDRKAWELELSQRLEEERMKSRADMPRSQNGYPPSRTESPSHINRKGSPLDLFPPQNRRLQGRSVSGEAPGATSHSSRRPAAQPLSTGAGTPPIRQDSLTSLSHMPLNGIRITETPSIHTADPDEYFDGIGSPSSPHRTINDIISVSTAGAGPSVQLVERMSAAVRRLESEKAATKEEVIRLSAQRDEARGEVVALMREVEQKRAADAKVNELEEEIAKINQRYETTLEMLGEKAELVEELKADIADLKQMYRDLVDSTMK